MKGARTLTAALAMVAATLLLVGAGWQNPAGDINASGAASNANATVSALTQGTAALTLNANDLYGPAVSLTGPAYSDSQAPLWRLGTQSFLSYPQGLICRDANGGTNAQLIASAFYASGLNGTNDGLQSIGGNVAAGALKSFRFNNSSRLTDAGDGKLALTNNANTTFTGVSWGPYGDPNAPTVSAIYGSPVGVLSASPGSLALNRAGGVNTSVYVKGSGVGNANWLALPQTRNGLGPSDANDLTTIYEVEEFITPGNVATQSSSGTGASAGNNNISNPADPVAAIHPGLLVAQTGGVGYASCFSLRTFVTTKASGVTILWRGVFRMPDVASTAADRYTFSVGTISTSAASVTSGAFLQYNDSVNSGQWTCNTIYSVVEGINTTNSTVAVPAPGTWHTLVITNGPGSAAFSFQLDGTSICSVTDSNMNTGGTLQHSLGGVHLNRSASSASAVYTALFDRGSLYMTGLVR